MLQFSDSLPQGNHQGILENDAALCLTIMRLSWNKLERKKKTSFSETKSNPHTFSQIICVCPENCIFKSLPSGIRIFLLLQNQPAGNLVITLPPMAQTLPYESNSVALQQVNEGKTISDCKFLLAWMGENRRKDGFEKFSKP